MAGRIAGRGAAVNHRIHGFFVPPSQRDGRPLPGGLCRSANPTRRGHPRSARIESGGQVRVADAVFWTTGAGQADPRRRQAAGERREVEAQLVRPHGRGPVGEQAAAPRFSPCAQFGFFHMADRKMSGCVLPARAVRFRAPLPARRGSARSPRARSTVSRRGSAPSPSCNPGKSRRSGRREDPAAIPPSRLPAASGSTTFGSGNGSRRTAPRRSRRSGGATCAIACARSGGRCGTTGHRLRCLRTTFRRARRRRERWSPASAPAPAPPPRPPPGRRSQAATANPRSSL